MQCPFCSEENLDSKVYPGRLVSTCMGSMPYYDENGTYQHSDPNTHISHYSCSMGHKWVEETHKGEIKIKRVVHEEVAS